MRYIPTCQSRTNYMPRQPDWRSIADRARLCVVDDQQNACMQSDAYREVHGALEVFHRTQQKVLSSLKRFDRPCNWMGSYYRSTS
jgi:hypothetical protein